MDAHGPRELPAHRQDHRGPEGLEHGLRGGAGSGVVRRRRPRRLQDDRRRQDLEGRADDQREHGRHRPGDGPARPERAHRGRVPAPSPRVDLHRRRPRVGRLQDDGRRRHLAQGHDGSALGRPRPYRPRHVAEGPGRGLRDGRDRGRLGRRLPLDRPRRDVEEARRLLQQRQVLRRDLRRPGQRGPRLLDGHVPPGVRRRRQDLARPGRGLEARGQPRDLGGPVEHRPHADGLRRRRVRDVRRGEVVELQGEPAGGAVLPRHGGRLVAVLPRLRRHAGQLERGRAVAHARRERHHQPGLVLHLWRRRLHQQGRAGQPGHRLRAAAVRDHRALRPEDRPGPRHPAAGGPGSAAAALELGRAAHHQPVLADAALLRREHPVPQRRPRQHVEGRQPGPHAAARPQHAEGDGPGLAARRGGQGPVHVDLRQHRLARRVGRSPRACSTSAPTTASCR